MGIYAELHSFGLVHRACVGPRHADATSRASHGYRLLVGSGCGADFRRLARSRHVQLFQVRAVQGLGNATATPR
jgi:hypothetical protein